MEYLAHSCVVVKLEHLRFLFSAKILRIIIATPPTPRNTANKTEGGKVGKVGCKCALSTDTEMSTAPVVMNSARIEIDVNICKCGLYVLIDVITRRVLSLINKFARNSFNMA